MLALCSKLFGCVTLFVILEAPTPIATSRSSCVLCAATERQVSYAMQSARHLTRTGTPSEAFKNTPRPVKQSLISSIYVLIVDTFRRALIGHIYLTRRMTFKVKKANGEEEGGDIIASIRKDTYKG